MSTRRISIALPEDLLIKVKELAQREKRTMSELMRDALESYLEWRSLLARTRAHGKALGIMEEADVEHLSDQYRRAKQR